MGGLGLDNGFGEFLFAFDYRNINTKFWINLSKEKKEIFDSWRRRNIIKNTNVQITLKNFYSGDL